MARRLQSGAQSHRSPREPAGPQLAALCAADLLVELSSWELKVKAEQLCAQVWGLENGW